MATDNRNSDDLPSGTALTNLMPLLTIGYGGKRSIEEFVELLHQHGVKYLVDVRTKPTSRFRPEYSKDAIEAALKRSGLIYAYMGDELGGLPNDPTCYTDGKVDYCKVRERDWFLRGLKRLDVGWRSGHRIAIMCAESEPHRCHRSKLIGEALIMRGVVVNHIDENGVVVTHEAAMARLNGGQSVLFEVGYKSRKAYMPKSATSENYE